MHVFLVYVPPLLYVSPFGTDDTRVNPTEDACNPPTHVYSGAPWLHVYTQGPPGHICRFRGPWVHVFTQGPPWNICLLRGPLDTYVYSGALWVHMFTKGPPGYICLLRGPLDTNVYSGAP